VFHKHFIHTHVNSVYSITWAFALLTNTYLHTSTVRFALNQMSYSWHNPNIEHSVADLMRSTLGSTESGPHSKLVKEAKTKRNENRFLADWNM